MEEQASTGLDGGEEASETLMPLFDGTQFLAARGLRLDRLQVAHSQLAHSSHHIFC